MAAAVGSHSVARQAVLCLQQVCTAVSFVQLDRNLFAVRLLRPFRTCNFLCLRSRHHAPFSVCWRLLSIHREVPGFGPCRQLWITFVCLCANASVPVCVCVCVCVTCSWSSLLSFSACLLIVTFRLSDTGRHALLRDSGDYPGTDPSSYLASVMRDVILSCSFISDAFGLSPLRS